MRFHVDETKDEAVGQSLLEHYDSNVEATIGVVIACYEVSSLKNSSLEVLKAKLCSRFVEHMPNVVAVKVVHRCVVVHQGKGLMISVLESSVVVSPSKK